MKFSKSVFKIKEGEKNEFMDFIRQIIASAENRYDYLSSNSVYVKIKDEIKRIVFILFSHIFF